MAQAAIAERQGGTAAPRARVLPPVAGRRSAMPAILALSLAVHAGVIAALLAVPATPAPSAEIAVEVVPEMPKVAGEKAEGDAQAAKPEAGGKDEAKAEKTEQAAAKPPEPTAAEKAEQAKVAQDKAEQERADQEKAKAAEQAQRAQAEQARADQAKAEQAKAEQDKAEQDRAEQAKAQQAQQAEMQAMRDELARLQAERQALQAAEPPPEPPSLRGGMPNPEQAQPSGQAAGVGPLASSFQAIALPQESTDGEGELAGYQAIVFSRLAKAKAVGRQLGIPGSAGVSFTVDEHGALRSLRLAVPSGIKKLDEEALAIVRRAAPFPVPPEGARRSFEANVSFIAGG